MGRLTTTEKEWLAGGGPVKMDWAVIGPTGALHAAYTTNVFDQGMYPTGGTDNIQRVTKPGKRTFKVWNPHPAVSPKMTAVRYVFECNNRDGFFYTGAGNAWDQGTIYAACTPAECYIQHRIYIGQPDDSIQSWSEVGHMRFIGKVKFVTYDDGMDAEGNIVPVSATITCEQAFGDEVLRMKWNSDHGGLSEVNDIIIS